MARALEGRAVAAAPVARVRTQDDAGLVHFQWLRRGAGDAAEGEPEVDTVVFPGDAVFEKVQRGKGAAGWRDGALASARRKRCPARVFLLKFAEEPSRNLLFWAQERSAERDEEDVAAVTAALNQIEGEAKPMGPQALMCAKPGAPHQPRG